MSWSNPFLEDVRRLGAGVLGRQATDWGEEMLPVWNPRLDLSYDVAGSDADPTGRDVVIDVMGKQHRTRLRWKTAALATHYTLDCPMTGKAVRALYVLGDQVGSREALGLRYSSRHAPRAEQRDAKYRRLSRLLNGDGIRKAARAGNRNRLLSQLSGLDTDQMDERDRRAVLKWRRTNTPDEPITQTALARAHSGYQMVRPADRLRQLASVSLPPDLSPRLRVMRQGVDRCPAVKLADLLEADQNFGGRGWVLEYPDHTVVYAEQIVSAEGLQLRLGWEGDQSGYQEFALTDVDGALQTPCPVTGRPTGALFLRNGRWASAKAQRLS
ncbi:MAG: hypothetical protein QME55_00105 [Brevundimonas sp.]|uniref:hypothetical protein n=1 Tax=Brevundimonas sp. TaxID=1871086 RepID=UPI0026247624|nr:hypothetical protein [Brevundimonas sp.]MDI6623105.1 hypothetical protein [Brevundimonas sp.]MDQ7812131.1 hypothetical protein [Brevundimonas sp.]